jgi:hypothetical protein
MVTHGLMPSCALWGSSALALLGFLFSLIFLDIFVPFGVRNTQELEVWIDMLQHVLL